MTLVPIASSTAALPSQKLLDAFPIRGAGWGWSSCTADPWPCATFGLLLGSYTPSLSLPALPMNPLQGRHQHPGLWRDAAAAAPPELGSQPTLLWQKSAQRRINPVR